MMVSVGLIVKVSLARAYSTYDGRGQTPASKSTTTNLVIFVWLQCHRVIDDPLCSLQTRYQSE